MNVNDCLELTLYQRGWTDVEIRNVLTYVVTAVGTGDEGTLADAFYDDVLPEMLAVQHVIVSHYKMTVSNLTDGLGYAENNIVPDVPGSLSGSAMPPFVAWAFRKNRLTRATRSGQLRVAGLSEGAQENGIAVAAIIDDLDDLAEKLYLPLTHASGASFAPCILRKTPAGGVDTINGIVSVEYVSVSSQNTRKYGRGI
jgi:hypothetical protein